MGLLPTFYAHWRLNAVVRSWRKLDKICKSLLSFSSKYSTADHKEKLMSCFEKTRQALDEVIKDYENNVLAELKKRV